MRTCGAWCERDVCAVCGMCVGVGGRGRRAVSQKESGFLLKIRE